MLYQKSCGSESILNDTRPDHVSTVNTLWQKQTIKINMKKTTFIQHDRCAEDDDPHKIKKVDSDEADQGPIVVAIALLIFIGLLIGLFVTSVYGDETKSTDAPIADTTTESNPYKDWKPPATPKIEIKSPIDPEQSKRIAEQWGVEIISLSLTAANYMIDFRFKVLDVEKSKNFFDHRIKPYLLVERSHAKLPIPMAAKVGAFRATNRGNNIKPNTKYYMVFGNPDAHVKSGDKVTMVIGDFKAEHMTVH